MKLTIVGRKYGLHADDLQFVDFEKMVAEADRKNLPCLEKFMIVCDLCGQAKACLPKEIEGKEYDICSECWNSLAETLKGKGRVKEERRTVFLPTPLKEPEPQQPKPEPGKPPIIWGEGRPQ